jgi:hypothetical protein
MGNNLHFGNLSTSVTVADLLKMFGKIRPGYERQQGPANQRRSIMTPLIDDGGARPQTWR